MRKPMHPSRKESLRILASIDYEQVQKLHDSGIPLTQIARDNGLSSPDALSKRLREIIGIKSFRGICDSHYFDVIDTPEKAYFLGWLISDGYIQGNRIQLKIHQKDEAILHKMRACLGIRNPVQRLNHCPQAYLSINSKEMVLALAKYGVIPNKTFTTFFPKDNVPFHFQRDLIRGILDGDGCIYHNKTTNTWRADIAGTHSLLEGIVSVIGREVGVFPTFTQQGKTYRIFYHTQKVKAFLDFIYQGATIYLERKHQKYEELLLHRQNKKQKNVTGSAT